jgi:hypothetical protein
MDSEYLGLERSEFTLPSGVNGVVIEDIDILKSIQKRTVGTKLVREIEGGYKLPNIVIDVNSLRGQRITKYGFDSLRAISHSEGTIYVYIASDTYVEEVFKIKESSVGLLKTIVWEMIDEKIKMYADYSALGEEVKVISRRNDVDLRLVL